MKFVFVVIIFGVMEFTVGHRKGGNCCQDLDIIKRVLSYSGHARHGGHHHGHHRGYKYAAFSTYLGSSLTGSSTNQRVVFDKVETNYGNAYDPKTGIFTCPTFGIYVFHWSSLTKHGYQGHREHHHGHHLGYKYAAFSTYLGSNLRGSSNDQRIVFDKVETNYGNAYDPKTGIFTCPTSGIYVFHWTSLTSHSYVGWTSLFINGKHKRWGSYANSKSHGAHGFKSGSSDAVYVLNKGDTVWIATGKGNYLNANHTTFQGWLQKAL